MSESPPGALAGAAAAATQQAQKQKQNQQQETSPGNSSGTNTNNGQADNNLSVPKPKRLACIICRRRKLKCDGIKPSCSTCSRLGHTCAYDETRRKSGPKRGYVKALEERLKQVETLLKTRESPKTSDSSTTNHGSSTGRPLSFGGAATIQTDDRDWASFGNTSPQNATAAGGNSGSGGSGGRESMSSFVELPNKNSWDMVALGLEEPLPAPETIDELHNIYFEKVHPSMPMIHKFRYLAAMNLAPNQRPPICLRYAIWTQASSVADKYQDFKDIFYQRARKYMELDYMKGFGEHMISVAHAQTHVLLASYEFKMMYFPRAWMSTGSAVKLSQMIGLNRLDSNGLDVKQCLPPPRDWTEREERRRTFWMAFCQDRYGSIGTGWPMTVDERDITTNLPASEEAFDMSKPEQMGTLKEAMNPAGAAKLSAFGSIVLLASLFGRNLVHLHRPDPEDRDHDLNGEFWKRHRQMDNILLNTSLCLPPQLKLPDGLMTPNIIFTNMSIHTSTICLHQAAIFKADNHHLPNNVGTESKIRCITAANEVASIMRMIAHMDLSSMNPFIAFCLYVAARVFVQYLKSRPDDGQVADSLRFLLGAMGALKRKNPLTESFLVQLDVDLDSLMTRIPKLRNSFPRSTDLNNTPSFGGTASRSAVNVCNNNPSCGGILNYRNECQFLRASEENGRNPSQQQNLIDHSPNDQTSVTCSTHSSDVLLAATFIQQLDQRTSMPLNTGMSVPHLPPDLSLNNPPDTPSTSARPTPQSQSSASDHLSRSSATQSQSQPASMNSVSSQTATMPSGCNSFESSQATDPVRIQGFFADTSDFGMAGGLDGFQEGVGNGGFVAGWEDVGNQPSMTPVAEGVLRSLMNLGPMDAMDLSSWDQHIQ